MVKGLGNDGRYWAALAEGHLELPKCGDCGEWHWPAPYRCADCGGWNIVWNAVPIEGRIYSWASTPHPFEGTQDLGSPYVTLCVELPQAGNIRLFGLLTDNSIPAIGAQLAGEVRISHVMGRDIPALYWSARA